MAEKSAENLIAEIIEKYIFQKKGPQYSTSIYKKKIKTINWFFSEKKCNHERIKNNSKKSK